MFPDGATILRKPDRKRGIDKRQMAALQDRHLCAYVLQAAGQTTGSDAIGINPESAPG
jgi:hypothetical protein